MGKLKEFMSLNKDIFIRTMCLVLVFSFFTARSASSDLLSDGEETILAVNSLLMQYFMFFSFLIDGFAHAAEALTGRFVGENNRQSLSQSTRMLFIWGTFIGLTFTIIYLTGREVILKVLTNNPEIIDNARQYFPWVISIPLISFSAFLWDGIYIGATAGKEMRNSMLISTVLVFFPAYLLGSNIMGNHGLWFAFILFMISRGLTMTVLAPRALYSRLKGPKKQTMAQ